MKKIKILSAILFVVFLFVNNTITSQKKDVEFTWPKELVTSNKSVITLYQPQLESFEGNILEGRMAVTVKLAKKDLMFGALWFKATMSTDKGNRTVLLEKMQVLKTYFPDVVDKKIGDEFSKLLATEIESWDMEMSLDRLTASLKDIEDLKELSDDINNDPPRIYFRTNPAVLVMIDGDPIEKKDDKSGLEYIVNTNFFIVKESNKDIYYIKGGSFWYASNDIQKGWKETKKVPSKIKKFAKDNLQESEEDSVSDKNAEAPELIIETKPAELIIVDGKLDYKPIEGTSLLYVANSESDILMDISSQYHYILIAGRWYYSKSLENGDWKFKEPKDLPEDFKKIPEESEMKTVRASIPGTPEAETALLEQTIPQTATIDRKTAKVEVKYDGDPEFEKIEGTDMSYAKNTDKSVLLINNKYYCVDDAVWFMSKKATGPWKVSDEKPEEVDQIPPESPVYNVKYTYVYDSTPEEVQVGYLPGYTNSYVYDGTVVYGTGYHYYPWYGNYYYPRPFTWGFGVHWNPYGGWGFSFGIGFGWMGWGFHPYRMGMWGAAGYRMGYRHGYRQGYNHGRHDGYNRGGRDGFNGGRNGNNRGNLAGNGSLKNKDIAGNGSLRNKNIYSNRDSGVKDTRNNRSAKNVNNRSRSTGKANNMYSDKGGNVYQRNQSGGFDNKSNKRQPSGQKQQNLNRSYQNRSSGTQNYNRSRSSAGMRSGGMRGGGGGRRR